MLRVSIDGACRRNGKPDCVSAGGVFVQQFDEAGELVKTWIRSDFETESTNQRGEMLALLKALDFVGSAEQDAQIITDSEYLFNAMTKQWYITWHNQSWTTSSGTLTKNADIWLEIMQAMQRISTDVIFYHIKGHCMSMGKVTSSKLLDADDSGMLLLSAVRNKYSVKPSILADAQELSLKNNGFKLDRHTFEQFVIANTVVDAIATKVVEAADRKT